MGKQIPAPPWYLLLDLSGKCPSHSIALHTYVWPRPAQAPLTMLPSTVRRCCTSGLLA